MSGFWDEFKKGLGEAILNAIFPARNPQAWQARIERERRANWRHEQDMRYYYARRAEDARMRYLMNPNSQQAPPGDWYR